MKNLIVALLLITFLSCEQSKDDLKRPAGGTADEIIVVVDSAVWEGEVGIELREILAAPMQVLPQDEALFDIYTVNPLKLNSVLKSAYNMIFITTLDSKTRQSKELRRMFTDESLKKIEADTSRFQLLEKNKFATGQQVLHLFGNTSEELANHIANNRAGILSLFEERALEITQKRILKSRSTNIEKIIKDHHGVDIKIPYGWDLAKDNIDFIWVRELGTQKEKNIFIYKEPYSNTGVFNRLPELRDKITELHLRDVQKPELFITRQDLVPVVSSQVNFQDKFAMRSVGLWAVSDMTAGGPFLSYTMVDEKSQMLYYIEGYVYHAAGKKKKLMREMDAILSTFKMPSETN